MKPVKVYTTDYCAYCRMAKNLLTGLDIPFEEVDVSADDAARAMLVERSGQMTVPQIFIGNESVGGYTELRALADGGTLAQRLAD